MPHLMKFVTINLSKTLSNVKWHQVSLEWTDFWHILTRFRAAGAPQGASFKPQSVRFAFGYWGGVIFATATPSLSKDFFGPPNGGHPSHFRLIWKVTGGARETKIPIYNKIKVRLFCFASSSPDCFLFRLCPGMFTIQSSYFVWVNSSILFLQVAVKFQFIKVQRPT